MSHDVELLQQRVSKQRDKLALVTGIVELAEVRLDASSAAYDDAHRERKQVKATLELAKRRAHRLAKDAKRAKKRARATADGL